MDLEALKAKIFTIRAKDELGQYLDDEQEWRAELEYTSRMEARLADLVKEALTWRKKLQIQDEDNWILARKVVELILRRRGGEDYQAFRNDLLNEIKTLDQGALSWLLKSDKPFFNWLDRW